LEKKTKWGKKRVSPNTGNYCLMSRGWRKRERRGRAGKEIKRRGEEGTTPKEKKTNTERGKKRDLCTKEDTKEQKKNLKKTKGIAGDTGGENRRAKGGQCRKKHKVWEKKKDNSERNYEIYRTPTMR